ncbi:hypothetical protein OAU50_07575 [Planctomycetota bacterium]|nr:hypothetical protein [Planctomycetota bacterium]
MADRHRLEFISIVKEELRLSEHYGPLIWVRPLPEYQVSFECDGVKKTIYLAYNDGTISFSDDPEVWSTRGHVIYLFMAIAQLIESPDDRFLLQDLNDSILGLQFGTPEYFEDRKHGFAAISNLVRELEEYTDIRLDEFWEYTPYGRAVD